MTIATPVRARDLDPDLFRVHETELASGQRIAYLHEGRGGTPLLLLHGWPETMRIWWRVVEPLAAAGFEVICPDLRGFGGSAPAHDGFYDLAAFATDIEQLVRGTLGNERCVACGGDVGGAVLIDAGLRFPGLIQRQVIFNSVLPRLSDAFRRAGLPDRQGTVPAASGYFHEQGHHADALIARLGTDDACRRYVSEFYEHRFWAHPSSFDPESVAFHAAPFVDPSALRRSFGVYEAAVGTRARSGPARFAEPSPVPTLALYGASDHVISRDFLDRCQLVFTDLAGPVVVPRCGHFVQWERADVIVKLVGRYLGG